MNKLISRQTHGIIDYAYSVIAATLPQIAGFKEVDTAKNLCKALAGGALTYSLLTKAEWGAAKIIPFKTHLIIDSTTSIFALTAPWLLGFSHHKRARNSVLLVGLAGLAVSLLTERKDM